MHRVPMNRSVLAITLAGLVTTASAGIHVSLSFDNTSLEVGQSITGTITAVLSDVAAGSYFSSAIFDLVCSQSEGVAFSPLTGLGWAMPVLGEPSGGTPASNGIFGIYATQQALFGPVDTSNPFVIGTFTMTGLPGLNIFTPLSFVVENGAIPGAFSYIDAADGPFAAPIFVGPEVFSSDTLVWVPSPGGVVVLAAGGLVAGRRRR